MCVGEGRVVVMVVCVCGSVGVITSFVWRLLLWGWGVGMGVLGWGVWVGG